MPNRKQRKANRQAKRGKRQANFKQSGFYKMFHKEKPKGFRGHQKIKQSDSRGGLTGGIGLKEKLQDMFGGGHDDCPQWELDKDTGQKICTSGGGKPSSSGGSSSSTTKTTGTSSTKTTGGHESAHLVMNWPGLNFNRPNIELQGFGVEAKAGGEIETGGWHVPLKLDEDGAGGASGSSSGFLSFSKTGKSEKEEQDSMKDNEIMVNEEIDEDGSNKKNVRYVESPPGGF